MCVCVYIHTYNTTNVCNGTSLYAFLISVVCIHVLSTVTVTLFFLQKQSVIMYFHTLLMVTLAGLIAVVYASTDNSSISEILRTT